MSSARLRPCMTSRYNVSYCNDGTVSATGVYVEVTFDSSITSITSTIPWSSQSGYTYTFLVDTLEEATCGSFQISAVVSCSTTVGATHCFKAQIFPEPSCFPDPISWDKSSIEVEGSCVDDSLACFWLFNTGDASDGDMHRCISTINNMTIRTGRHCAV